MKPCPTLDHCPECGSAEVVRITPAMPGPIGWGGRCKACGHRWSIDADDERRVDVDFAVRDAAAEVVRRFGGFSEADCDGHIRSTGAVLEERQR